MIPVLLVRDEGLVKTTRFENPRYVGDPVNTVRIFNEKEVDEIALLDISATTSGRGPQFELVEDVASECFMPLAYGGGVKTLDDAKRLFALGVEKVIIRTAAAEDPRIVEAIAHYAGSSSVAVDIDVRLAPSGEARIHGPGTKLDGDSDWIAHITRVIDAGAGEIIINAVDRDGTMSGMDLELISQARGATSVPLVALGGAGSLEDIVDAVRAGADAVGAGAFFVFHGPRRAVLITYPSYDRLSAMLGDS